MKYVMPYPQLHAIPLDNHTEMVFFIINLIFLVTGLQSCKTMSVKKRLSNVATNDIFT